MYKPISFATKSLKFIINQEQVCKISLYCVMLLSLVFINPLSVLAVESGEIQKEKKSENIITEDHKKILTEDAQRLNVELKKLFKDLTGVGNDVAIALVDYISVWIDNNYAKLSAEKQQQINEFINAMIEKYKDIEQLSLETIQNIMTDFNTFFNNINKTEKTKGEVIT